MVARTAQKLAKRQQLENAAEALHFTLEVVGEPDPDALGAAIAAALPGVAFELTHLVPEAGAPMDRFFRLVVPGVAFADADFSGFDVAYDLQNELGLASVEAAAPFDAPASGSPVDTPFEGPPEEQPTDGLWHLKRMRVPEAWSYAEAAEKPDRGRNIFIAQPDTGSGNHVSMQGGRWAPGWNVMDRREDPTDPMDYWFGNPGHGQSVAVVAAGNELVIQRNVEPRQVHMAGAAPLARLRPYRCVNRVLVSGENSEFIAEGVARASLIGCSVISMSLGGAYLRSYPPEMLSKAIQQAAGRGAVIVAAAGNYVGEVTYPGWDRNVICLAASGIDDKPWTYSCAGKEVAVTAPGHQIWTSFRAALTDPADLVGLGSGTSYATANTAGVAALWFAYHGIHVIEEAATPPLVNRMFRDCLRAACRRPNNWDEAHYGAGIVDALMTLRAPLRRPTPSELDEAEGPSSHERLVRQLRRHGVGETALARVDEAFGRRYGAELDWIMARRDSPDASAGTPVSDALAAAFPAARSLAGALEPAE